jgi:hypothetical protein
MLAGVAILLVFGTDILNWYWPAMMAGAAVVFAAVGMRRGILTRYRVAQLLDSRLGLNDSLATAWFLLSRRRLDSAAAEFQIEQAERICASVRVSEALPFTGRRGWTATACVAVIAFGLFAVRYFKIESLSLRAPMIPVHAGIVLDVENFFSSHAGWLPFGRHVRQRESTGANRAERQRRGTSEASQPGDAFDTRASQTRSGMQSEKAAGPDANRNQQPAGRDANPDPAQAEQNSPSSLLRRMKEGLSSLMAQMGASGHGKRSPQTGPQAGNKMSNRESSSLANTQANGQHGANAQAQMQPVQKQGAGLQRSQASSRKGSDARSGIGSQNGDKDLKRAQELAAMGKLAEILGKRSADVTGDMSVRTLSGTTELQTPYTQQVGRHADLGGEIHRDEVPLIYRDYVRRYMEEVHRNADQNPPAR